MGLSLMQASENWLLHIASGHRLSLIIPKQVSIAATLVLHLLIAHNSGLSFLICLLCFSCKPSSALNNKSKIPFFHPFLFYPGKINSYFPALQCSNFCLHIYPVRLRPLKKYAQVQKKYRTHAHLHTYILQNSIYFSEEFSEALLKGNPWMPFGIIKILSVTIFQECFPSKNTPSGLWNVLNGSFSVFLLLVTTM